ncbi:centromere protein Chl4/mis15/CENP-N [Dactylonectria estremocensis]|uniref:Centromere protein Chl4/mis15/CENP-N n=1 Tax=Dactylonectria estremocensis TaxID=1079267 RepID=A0A9P9F7W1_9HYPO|nr:centromere protein Chl4/mis15/CENP-N [Dactylonectria estremocensis]
MARISVPTAARLPSSLRVDSANIAVQKSLSRLSRESLISLVLDWLDDGSLLNAIPYLQAVDDEDGDPDDIYPPCQSPDEIHQLYLEMQQQKGPKSDVISRILEGDWRHGLTLYQLAMADFAYFDQNPTSQRWSAYQVLPLTPPPNNADGEATLQVDRKSLSIPRFHPSTFLQNLQDQVLPDVKTHYQFHRPKDLPVLILRIFVIDSPYTTNLAFLSRDGSGNTANFDSSRTIYIAFPDGSPALYITKSQGTGSTSSGESKSLQSLIVDGVPKALSRPRERYTVKSSNLASRNLEAILEKKGSRRTNSAAGGWSIYSDEKKKESPLDTVLPIPPVSRLSSDSGIGQKRMAELTPVQRAAKRAKVIAEARFGDSGIVTDGKGVEKVDIVIQDEFLSTRVPVDEGDEERSTGEAGDVNNKAKRRRSKIDVVIQEANSPDDDDGTVGDTGGSQTWVPTVKISLQGTHVWAGVRQLVEAGIVDGERMPGWMTGEDGVTTGIVRHGRIRGYKGSGMK